MTKPFHKSLDWFRGREVIARSNEGYLYRGVVERIHNEMRHLVLKDAERYQEDGFWERVGAAFVAHCDNWMLADPPEFATLELTQIEPSPYHQREFDAEGNAGYIKAVHDNGWAESFPVVRPREDDSMEYECVAGNKRLWAAEKAGLRHHPVEVKHLTDREAATAFAFDHFPLPHHGDDHSQYSDDQVYEAVVAMRERLGNTVFDIWPVAWNLERLGLTPDQVGLDEFEGEQ